jgi:hypothetical protein
LKLTPQQEERIRQLFKLITDEKDPETVQVLVKVGSRSNYKAPVAPKRPVKSRMEH